MRKIFKKITAVIAAATMIIAMTSVTAPIFAAEYEVMQSSTLYQGSCIGNPDITWEYDIATKTMTFRGTGEMQDYRIDWKQDNEIVPEWKQGDFEYDAQHVVFEDGITVACTLSDMFGNLDTYESYTLTAGETLQVIADSDYYALELSWTQKCKIECYGYYGSAFYYAVPDMQFHGLGIAENEIEPTSGTTLGGAEWYFDYETYSLTIDNGTFVSEEDNSSVNFGPHVRTVYYGKNFTPPAYAYKDAGGNDLNYNYYVLHEVYQNNHQKIYFYQGSPFADAVDELIAADILPDYGYNDYTVLNGVLTGDINLDNKIDLTDAVMISKAVAGSVTLSPVQLDNADVDGNGSVEAADNVMLLQFLLRLIDSIG